MRSLLVVLVVISACMIDSEPELSQTEQDITWTVVTTRDCTTQSCNNVELGDASTRTCFLAGIAGPFTGSHIDKSTSWGRVSIDPVTNQWEINTKNDVTKISATCIQTVAGRVFSTTADQDKLIGSVAGGRRCFLTQVAWNYMTHDPATYGDHERLYIDHGYWHLESALTGNVHEAIASAVCVNVPVLVGNYSFGHDASGSVTNPLPTLQNSGACGLTAINGLFRGTPYPGVRINNFGSMQWSLTLDEHVGATVACVQPF